MKIERQYSALWIALLILINTFSMTVMADEPPPSQTISAIKSVYDSTTPPDALENLEEPQSFSANPLEVVVDSGNTASLIRQTDIPSEAPIFSAELISDGVSAGIYGTLNYIPADTIKISVLYSFGEEIYYSVENQDTYGFRAWDLTGLSESTASLTQLCIGSNDSPFKAYLREGVNTLSVKLQITQMTEDGSAESFTQAIKFSHNKTWTAPEVPPDFTAIIDPTEQGYLLKGKFTDFLPNTVRVRPLYSLDGENYQVICQEEPYDWQLDKLGAENESELSRLHNQICAASSVEPLKSYLDGEINMFYTKLQITLEDGVSYYTKTFEIARGTPRPLPDNAQVYALFPSSMRVIDRSVRPFYTYGKYQIVVREDAKIEEIYSVLPKTVPVEIQIALEGTSSAPITGVVQAGVVWKALPDLHLTAGETFTITDAAEDLLIFAGTQVHTPLGVYVLANDLRFDQIFAHDEIRLIVNVIGKDEKPEVSLSGSLVEDASSNQLPLSLSFSLKPSGATAIEAYSYAEGDTSWTKLCNLLTIRAVDANQSQQLYGYVDILQPADTPYQAYLQGKSSGFLIALTIKGGVYDGKAVILSWPGEYNPPAKIPEIGGSGGNENNAGNGGDGSGGNGGQRPDLPDDEKPPVTSQPPPESDSDGDDSFMPTSVNNESILPPPVDPNAYINILPLQNLNIINQTSLPTAQDDFGDATAGLDTLQDESLDQAPHTLADEQSSKPEIESTATTAQPTDTEAATRTPPNQTALPSAAAIALLAVGAATAIGTGAAVNATGSISAVKVFNNLIAILKKLLLRK